MTESVYHRRQSTGQLAAHGVAQRQPGKVLEDNRGQSLPLQRQPNGTGLPDKLKAGMENLSGINLDGVKVHRNSAKPAAVQAHAYAQGSDIHLGPGQEKHLPHELGHVVQQAQGKVKSTMQMQGVAVNDDSGLESEATHLGEMALGGATATGDKPATQLMNMSTAVAQRSIVTDLTKQVAWDFLIKHGMKALLSFSDTVALMWLESYETFKTVTDLVTKFSNAVSVAINLWDLIPAPVKTVVLYLTGRMVRSIPWAEDWVVDADQTKSATYLVKVSHALKLAIKAATSPISSVIDGGKFAYSWFTSTDDKDKQSNNGQSKAQSKGKSPEAEKADLASLDLKIIWLNVKQLQLKKTDEKEKQQGGLHADFALGVRLFGHEKTLGQSGSLTLILPFSGGAVLSSKETISLIDSVAIKGLFELKQLDMTEIMVTNDRIKTFDLALKKFAVGKDYLSLTDTTAQYATSSGLAFTGNAAVKLFDWAASAKTTLNLGPTGEFKRSSVESFTDSSKILKVKEAVIDKETGFELTEAAINFKKLTGLDITATINQMKIKNKSITGQGTVEAKALSFMDGKVKLNKVVGKIGVDTAHWHFSVGTHFATTFDHVTSEGEFVVGYDSASKKVDVKLLGGALDVKYDAFSASAKNVQFDYQKGEFSVDTAELDIHAINSKVTVQGFRLNKSGIDFNKATFAHPAPMHPFKGVTVDGITLTLAKDKQDYILTGESKAVEVDASPVVKGKATDLKLTFAKSGYEGALGRFDLNTKVFNLGIEKAKLNKQGLGIDQATLTIGGKGSESDEQAVGDRINGFDNQLFAFLPSGVGFIAKGIKVDSKGLHIQSFKPTLEKLSFDLLGVHGGLNFNTMTVSFGAEKSIDLETLAAGLPLKADVHFPVFPGVGVYGSLGAFGKLKLGLDFSAGGKGGVWPLSGKAGFNGELGLTAELGVEAGLPLLLSLRGGAFATGKVEVNATADVGGQLSYDRKAKRFKNDKPVTLDYSVGGKAIAEIGLVIKAKVLYFYEKTLYKYTAKQWTIGEYKVDGTIGDKKGELAPEKPSRMGLGADKALPAPAVKIEGQEEQKLLDSDQEIRGSGEARAKVLKEREKVLAKSVLSLHLQHNKAQSKYKEVVDKYIKLSEATHDYFLHNKSASRKSKDAKLIKVSQMHDKYLAESGHLAKVKRQLDSYQHELSLLITISPKTLEGGMGKAVSTMSEIESGLQHTKIPDPEALLMELDNDVQALKAPVAHSESSADPVAKVMPTEQFIKLSTTKGFFSNTDRKSIVPVDKALMAYHSDPSKVKLSDLKVQIEQYLSKSKSDRVPYVMILGEQVDEVLLTA